MKWPKLRLWEPYDCGHVCCGQRSNEYHSHIVNHEDCRATVAPLRREPWLRAC